MAVGKIDIYVYADWIGLSKPTLIGLLTAHQAKGRKAFSFEYEKEWLMRKEQIGQHIPGHTRYIRNKVRHDISA